MQACVCLFAAQPSLADQVPPLGHIPRIFERMNSDNDAIPKACVEVMNVLASSEVRIFLMLVMQGVIRNFSLLRNVYSPRPTCHTPKD